MRNNRGPRRALPGQHGGLRHRGPGRRPERRQHRHGQRQLGLPDDPPGPRDRAGGHARPLDPVPRRRRRRRGPTRSTLLAATLVAQTAYELFADPALVAAAWREFRGDGPTAAATGRGRAVLPSRRRAPLDDGFEPAAPPARRIRSRRGRRRDRLREDPVAERPHDPRSRPRLRARERLGPRVRDLHRLRPADLRRAGRRS